MSPAEKALARRCAKYAITPGQYVAMLTRQSGRCAICERQFHKTPNIDHDHKTNRVRGLLCYWCNHFLLGRGRENPEHHRRAAVYLESEFDARKIA